MDGRYLKRLFSLIGSVASVLLIAAVGLLGLAVGTPANELPSFLSSIDHRTLFVAAVVTGFISVSFQEVRTRLEAARGFKKLQQSRLKALDGMLERALKDNNIAEPGTDTRIFVYIVSPYLRYFPFKKQSYILYFRKFLLCSTAAATSSTSDRYVNYGIGEGIAGQVMRTKLLYRADLENMDDAAKKNILCLTQQQVYVTQKTQSSMGYPIFALKSRNELIGVLVIDSSQPFSISKLDHLDKVNETCELAKEVAPMLQLSDM